MSYKPNLSYGAAALALVQIGLSYLSYNSSAVSQDEIQKELQRGKQTKKEFVIRPNNNYSNFKAVQAVSNFVHPVMPLVNGLEQVLEFGTGCGGGGDGGGNVSPVGPIVATTPTEEPSTGTASSPNPAPTNPNDIQNVFTEFNSFNYTPRDFINDVLKSANVIEFRSYLTMDDLRTASINGFGTFQKGQVVPRYKTILTNDIIKNWSTYDLNQNANVSEGELVDKFSKTNTAGTAPTTASQTHTLDEM